MVPITIETTSMGFRVSVSANGIIKGTPYSIYPYASKFHHKRYDRAEGVYILINEYFHFYPDREIACFAKFDLPEFCTFLKERNIAYTIKEHTPVVGERVEFFMLPHITYKNDKQKNAVEFLTNPESGPIRGLGIQTGMGKSTSIDSFLKTPTGWVRNGDVKLGQLLRMPDGSVAPVKGIYPQGVIDTYRITFEDGRGVDCSLDHLWRVNYIQWKDKWRVITTEQIMNYLKQPTYAIRMGVQLVEHDDSPDVPLPIHPYVLGVWLGDGSTNGRSISICKPDDFMRTEVEKYVPEGLSVTPFMPDGKSFYIKGRTTDGNLRMWDILADLNLAGKVSYTKFIPDIYMNASAKQRLHILQGLMDTDGTVMVAPGRGNTEITPGKGGSIEFCTTSPMLAKQVQELIRSLGGLCRIRGKTPYYTHNGERREGRQAYILRIRYKNPKDLFRLPRKRDRLNDDYQYADRLKLRIKSVEYVGKKECQCIEVDHPDHLYITDDYIVTHNTVSCIMSVQKLAVRTMITMTSRLEQWVSEMGVYTTLEEDDIFVIQGLGSLQKLFSQIDTKIFPKIILASAKTIQNYLEYGEAYRGLPHPLEMCERLGIGIVATDEAHEWYHTNFIMNAVLNPAIFIPITATFEANDPFVKNLFEKAIPNSIQFSGGEYERYTNVTGYVYGGGSGIIKPYHYMRRMGYSQVKFEEYLLSAKGSKLLDMMLKDAILPMIREHYINICDNEDGERMLFLCATKEFGDHIASVLKRNFNSKTVSTFYSGMPSTILSRFDIIVSTPGSAGTGRDVKKLRTCFVFDNTASVIRNLQYLGRLRPYPATKHTPEFVYLSLRCIEQHQKYDQQRAILFGPRAKQFRHRTIS